MNGFPYAETATINLQGRSTRSNRRGETLTQPLKNASKIMQKIKFLGNFALQLLKIKTISPSEMLVL